MKCASPEQIRGARGILPQKILNFILPEMQSSAKSQILGCTNKHEVKYVD